MMQVVYVIYNDFLLNVSVKQTALNCKPKKRDDNKEMNGAPMRFHR